MKTKINSRSSNDLQWQEVKKKAKKVILDVLSKK